MTGKMHEAYQRTLTEGAPSYSQSDPHCLAGDVAPLIEAKLEAGVSIKKLGTNLERVATKLNNGSSGVRTLTKLKTEDPPLITLRRADEMLLSLETNFWHQPEIIFVACSQGAANAMVLAHAEVTEEVISAAELRERAAKLLRFSKGYIEGFVEAREYKEAA